MYFNIAETGGVTTTAPQHCVLKSKSTAHSAPTAFLPRYNCFETRRQQHALGPKSALALQRAIAVARQLRLEIPGGVYHLMSRGNAKQEIYVDDSDRKRFLNMLWRVSERLDWQVWAFCLMPNHYHLLIQITQRNLSRGMKDLNGAYAIGFNKRHHRVGHLFQGRFESRLVDRESYLLKVARYIVLNPLKAELCNDPAAWRWSSYRAMVGLAPAPPRLAVPNFLTAIGASGPEARAAFAEFVRAGLPAADPAADHRVPGVVGDDDFIEAFADAIDAPSPEVPMRQRAFKPLAQYEYEATSRNDAIKAAYASGAYTQAAIAQYFGLHYATVSRLVGNRGCRNVQIQDVTLDD